MPASRDPQTESTPAARPKAPASRAATPSDFAGLGLPAELVKVLAGLGYEEPTAVQRETIPPLSAGGDLLVQAATGTGTPAAFALPILVRLGAEPAGRKHPTRALVLVPTRELAIQVAEALHRYARGSTLSVVPVYGGAAMVQQLRALQRGADIVVATPGRALDHLNRGTLALDELQVLVLDEADEMLDLGFAEDLDLIVAATPESRQTTLFSATMPPRIESVAKRYLRDAQRLTVAKEQTAPGELPRVRQIAYLARRDQKPDVLGRVLDVEGPESALVFCRTRMEVDRLVELLNARGYRAEALHGGMQQRQRDGVMARFRAAKTELLVATDVAARGLDIKQLSHVVNYDLPTSVEAYVHRIGRTGRAGRDGVAISLVDPRERRLLQITERHTRQKIELAAIPSVADLHARRLSKLREAVRERLLAGELDDVRGVVDQLAEEFELRDIAAAGLRLAQVATGGERDADEREIEPVADTRRDFPPDEARGARVGPARGRKARGGGTPSTHVRLQVGAGRSGGIRPGDLVGAICNETDVPPKDLGAIEIELRSSFIDVPAERADEIIAALEGTTLRGKRVRVRRRPEG